MSTDWMDSANCATTDPELFTLDLGDSSRPAKRICAMCPSFNSASNTRSTTTKTQAYGADSACKKDGHSGGQQHE